MSKRRWSKFWWQDYERDPALRLCSLAAQGLWMRLLCLMHEAEPYGHLCVNNQPLHPRQLALMLGVSERQINRLMAELRNAGVYSTTPQGSIYSRRLLRDKAASDQGAAWGRTGGNPNLKTGAAALPSAAGVQSGAQSGAQSGSLSGSPSGGGTPPHNQPGQGGTIQPAITPASKHQEAEAEAETHSSLTASASLTPPGMADQMPHPATVSRRAQAHTAWQNVPDMEGV